MYTTACDHCRRLRVKCVRHEEGRVADEVCERCSKGGLVCKTTKRQVGRQRGTKNKGSGSRVTQTASPLAGPSFSGPRLTGLSRPVVVTEEDAEHLPNPLQVLALEAYHRDHLDEPEQDTNSYNHPFRSSLSVLEAFPEWSARIGGAAGRENLLRRIDRLLDNVPTSTGDLPRQEDNMVFQGRVDMPRPDAAPEDDVISLQIISLSDAQQLFDAFMRLITNGSMYFDPRLHTLAFVRTRSTFLLAVILSTASSYKAISPSALLHKRLQAHVIRLETKVWEQQLKSIEIIQGLLLLASWSEVPTTLARDKTWTYISHAIALAVELRIDTAMPYYVQTDPMLNGQNRNLLTRNAHRCCMLLYIHDRNMAMVAGRYPILPESSIFSDSNLAAWGRYPQAYHYDASISASVALRKLVSEVRDGLDVRAPLTESMASIDNSLEGWRRQWENETASTKEYDIIARFSTFVLVMTLVQRQQQTGRLESHTRRYCESVAFEVCCAAIDHYTSWTGLLNSATYDTSMVAYCALCIVQSIGSPSSSGLSDWSILRLATLQELVSLLELQAADRHQTAKSTGTNVVDAMSRRLSREIRRLLATSHPVNRHEQVLFDRDSGTLDASIHQGWPSAGSEHQVFPDTLSALANNSQSYNGNAGGLFLSDSAWQELLDSTAEPSLPILDEAELEAIVAGMPSFDMSWWAA